MRVVTADFHGVWAQTSHENSFIAGILGVGGGQPEMLSDFQLSGFHLSETVYPEIPVEASNLHPS